MSGDDPYRLSAKSVYQSTRSAIQSFDGEYGTVEKEHDHLCPRARRLAVMDDEALTDDWLAGERFVGGMSSGTRSSPSRDEEQ
jgi:hypothetical protein